MPKIFHITNIDNLRSIIKQRGLWCDQERLARCPSAVNIAYQDLKGVRSRFDVNRGPGGVLADYVPFYFAPRSPMLYAIANGRVANYDGGQRKIVYLVSSCEDVKEEGLKFVFTDGHAAKRFTQQYEDLEALDKIDWDLMDARYWADTDDDNDRKRRRQAEFLVHNFMPWDLIKKVVVYDENIAAEAHACLRSAEHQPVVEVNLGWYY